MGYTPPQPCQLSSLLMSASQLAGPATAACTELPERLRGWRTTPRHCFLLLPPPWGCSQSLVGVQLVPSGEKRTRAWWAKACGCSCCLPASGRGSLEQAGCTCAASLASSHCCNKVRELGHKPTPCLSCVLHAAAVGTSALFPCLQPFSPAELDSHLGSGFARILVS